MLFEIASMADVERVLTMTGVRPPEDPVRINGETEAVDGGARRFDPATIPDVFDVAAASVPFVVGDLLPEGAITMLASEGGAGKSTVALALAACIARGDDFAGLSTQRRPVLYLDRENPAAVVRERLGRFNLTRTPEGLHIIGTWLEDLDSKPLADGVVTWLRDNAGLNPVVILDSMVALMDGADENSATEVRLFFNPLRALAAAGCTVLVLHHSPKKAETAYRGSSDVLAAIDVGFRLTNLSPGGDLRMLRLGAFKRRIPVAEALLLEWDERAAAFRQRVATRVETQATIAERVLRANPRIGKKGFAKAAMAAGVSYKRALEFIDAGIENGSIQTEQEGNRHFHTWVGEGGAGLEPPLL